MMYDLSLKELIQWKRDQYESKIGNNEGVDLFADRTLILSGGDWVRRVLDLIHPKEDVVVAWDMHDMEHLVMPVVKENWESHFTGVVRGMLVNCEYPDRQFNMFCGSAPANVVFVVLGIERLMEMNVMNMIRNCMLMMDSKFRGDKPIYVIV